jgi:hypothetical protein
MVANWLMVALMLRISDSAQRRREPEQVHTESGGR